MWHSRGTERARLPNPCTGVINLSTSKAKPLRCRADRDLDLVVAEVFTCPLSAPGARQAKLVRLSPQTHQCTHLTGSCGSRAAQTPLPFFVLCTSSLSPPTRSPVRPPAALSLQVTDHIPSPPSPSAIILPYTDKRAMRLSLTMPILQSHRFATLLELSTTPRYVRIVYGIPCVQ